jgi:2-polyprenyl-6-methoxyphenol hydroxylase-like FAD-dependent oxidoreductase
MPKTVLISGGGIAGLTSAYWLAKAGLTPTVIERAPALRTDGYVIDFWGLGYDIAERMGLADDLERLGYHMQEMRIVDEDGRRITGFGTSVFRQLTGGRFVTIRRSDLVRAVFKRASPVAEVVFDDEIVGLAHDRDDVHVTFKHSRPRRFDLVIGAGGLHSPVRRLVFGPQESFELPLGYTVAAFETSGYQPRDESAYILRSEPGRMLARFALRDDRTLFLFVFADRDRPPFAQDLSTQRAVLRREYQGGEWETYRILDELDRAQDLYFDRVSQICMPHWSRARIALVGDAAFCVSLMAGQGSALAMTAAYVLAGELGRPGQRYHEAFYSYERLLRPFIETKQRGARRLSSVFAPMTNLGLLVRNLTIRTMSLPGLARYVVGREIVDKLLLPEYPWLSSFQASG